MCTCPDDARPQLSDDEPWYDRVTMFGADIATGIAETRVKRRPPMSSSPYKTWVVTRVLSIVHVRRWFRCVFFPAGVQASVEFGTRRKNGRGRWVRAQVLVHNVIRVAPPSLCFGPPGKTSSPRELQSAPDAVWASWIVETLQEEAEHCRFPPIYAPPYEGVPVGRLLWREVEAKPHRVVATHFALACAKGGGGGGEQEFPEGERGMERLLPTTF